MSNEKKKKFIKDSTDRSNPNIQDRNEGNLRNWKIWTEVKQLNPFTFIYLNKNKNKKKDERLNH